MGYLNKLFLFFSLIISTPLLADTIIVKSDGTGDQPNIQAAIISSASGDSICLVDSLYTGPGNRDINFMGKAITIFSFSGNPDSCVIDCEGEPEDQHFGISFTSGEDSTSLLFGITITDGFVDGSPVGSGISIENSSPKIEKCRITSNVNGGSGGGGIACIASSPILSHVQIDNNFAWAQGSGGLFCDNNSSPLLTDCQIDSNFGPDVAEKSVGAQGGGIQLNGNSNATLVRCRISNNYNLEASGAGMACLDSAPILTDCIFSGNYNDRSHSSGIRYGNGIDCYNSSLILTKCVFVNNGRNQINRIYGGAISARGNSHLQITDCTIVGNMADEGGGGIYLSESSMTATNTLIAFNEGESILTSLPGPINFEFCDIYGNSGGDWVGDFAQQLGSNGNIWLDPLFCDLAGEVFTLQADSPCLPANHPDGISNRTIGAHGLGCYLDEPHILSILDVDNDQGRQVRLIWNRSDFDSLDSPYPITGYGVYRQRSQFVASPDESPVHNKLLDWDFLTTVPARGDSGYSFVAPTLCDSTINSGLCMSTFMISGLTDNPLVYFDSKPDSGYSLDNLAPIVPSGLFVAYANMQNDLVWDPPVDSDVDHFILYRYSNDYMGEDPNFPVEVFGNSWVDTEFSPGEVGWDFFYRVAAVDFSGNSSPLTEWTDVSTSGIESTGLPIQFALHGNIPNPFNPMTKIQFDLPSQQTVNLRIFDLSGKLIRSLLEGTPMGPGSHIIHWNGRDSSDQKVAAGIYFFRLDAGSFSKTNRMTLLK